MKIEKIYLRICAAILVTILLWWVIAPQLISSPTDIGLVLGVACVLAVPVFDYWILLPIYKFYKEKSQTQKSDTNEKSK
jgi:TM2 domain-containing membrane protein YozV